MSLFKKAAMVAAVSIVAVFVAAFLGYTFLNEPKNVISDHKQTVISDKPTILIKNSRTSQEVPKTTIWVLASLRI